MPFENRPRLDKLTPVGVGGYVGCGWEVAMHAIEAAMQQRLPFGG